MKMDKTKKCSLTERLGLILAILNDVPRSYLLKSRTKVIAANLDEHGKKFITELYNAIHKQDQKVKKVK